MGGGLIQAMPERKYSFLKEVFLYLDIIISDKDGDHELRKTITMIMIKMVISFATQRPPTPLPPSSPVMRVRTRTGAGAT